MSKKKNKGEVIAVSVSEKKGMKKTPVAKINLIEDLGVEGDAHAEKGIKRQVSMLATESIDKMIALGLKVKAGDFAENITTKGIDLPSLSLGTIVKIGAATLRISQIGKVCHDRCNIYYTVGDCVMPKEGVFGVVVEGGQIKPGDSIIVSEDKK